MLDPRDEWPMVRDLLPDGWEQKARELGAVCRLRGVSSVEALLRVLLIHLADGCSLKQTSARVSQLGWGKMTAVGILKRLRAAERWPAWVKGPEDRWHNGRVVAVKRSLAATRRALRARRANSKSRERKPGRQALALARYVLVWTSVPKSEMKAREVLWHYRLRWQQELVFKRTKSIMGLGQLPKYSDASSRAWLNGKLLVAMLVEKLWRQAEHFSPWGYRVGAFAKPLA